MTIENLTLQFFPLNDEQRRQCIEALIAAEMRFSVSFNADRRLFICAELEPMGSEEEMLHLQWKGPSTLFAVKQKVIRADFNGGNVYCEIANRKSLHAFSYQAMGWRKGLEEQDPETVRMTVFDGMTRREYCLKTSMDSQGGIVTIRAERIRHR